MRCALCGSESELEESHIIPKFVYRTLKKNSPTGNMRMASEPNKKVQDGDKEKLLCGECEDLFNIDETLFANKVYHKFQQGTLQNFEYSEWLERFIISVNWRGLYLDIIGFVKEQNISVKDLEYLIECEKKLRNYLLGNSSSLEGIENHIFFFNEIQEANKEVAEMNLHSSVGSSVIGYTVVNNNPDGSYIFLNLQGLIMVTILNYSIGEEWRGTLVQKEGNFDLANPQFIRSPIMNEFKFISSEIKDSQLNLSDTQKDKILKAIQKNQEKFIKSNAYERVERDNRLNEKYQNGE
ncbi:hypothetical protein [Lysinibacillus boronitolerans]|uniref:hypothetical protein n=1 Tax=Lysinibacillus boronitolerans TaxID=309788 RepID=UPI0038528661